MDKLLLNSEDVAHRLGIGRTKVFELIRTCELPSVKIDGCRRVPARALEEFVTNLARP